MSLVLFQEFPPLWEQFEQEIRDAFLEQFSTDSAYSPSARPHALSRLYENVGWKYWRHGTGVLWFQRF